MRLATLAAFLGALALAVLAQSPEPYDFGVDVERLTRRADGPVIVGRLPLTLDGGVPHRLEIRQMRANQPQWDLFILALSMFQSVSQDDPLSWYQVAGIHGVPFRTWNGVEPAPGANMSGYCMHGSVLFPIWHRPYLALVEQELFRLASFIATMFPDPIERILYEEAASTIRLPYWDWALAPPPGQTHLPDVFWHPTIVQYGPRGVQTIRNPLYSYKFHPVEEDAMIWEPLKHWDETKRAPATNISIGSPPSINSEVDKALLEQLPNIQQRLFILFSSYKDFNSFGNKAWSVAQNMTSLELDSIEAVHDVIHLYGGLRGHMTYVPLSSFDPLFFIHHVTMDRLIAMWQVLNPTAWITPMPTGETSYNSVLGTIQTSKTPLTPFYISNDGTFWDSDMARYTTTFGYAYADTDLTFVAMGESLAESLSRKIAAWYGASVVMGLRDVRDDDRPTTQTSRIIGKPGNLRHARPNLRHDAADPPHSARLDANGDTWAWRIGAIVDTDALEGLFEIHFYLGEMSATCESPRSPNYAGSIAIRTQYHGHPSQSELLERKPKTAASTPINPALIKLAGAGYISSLDPAVVVPALRDALYFRVCASDLTEVDAYDVPGLRMIAITSKVILAEDGGILRVEHPVIRLKVFGDFEAD